MQRFITEYSMRFDYILVTTPVFSLLCDTPFQEDSKAYKPHVNQYNLQKADIMLDISTALYATVLILVLLKNDKHGGCSYILCLK